MPHTDPLLAALDALDLAVVEWLPDGTFQPFAPPPPWFKGTTQWSALPFLEHVVPAARRFWHDRTGGALTFGPFTLEWGDEELLVRVRALRLDDRLVLAVDRIAGEFDPRPMLRTAREYALEHEQLQQKAREVHAPVAALASAIDDLRQADLLPAQAAIVDRLAEVAARLQETAAALPAPFKRRR